MKGKAITCQGMEGIPKTNVGLPSMVGGHAVHDGTPEIMAGFADQACSAGAQFIGACRGSTPDPIHAMAPTLNQM